VEVENLRHRTLDDLPELFAFRHAQRTVPNTRVFAVPPPYSK
jgi:hypothetical protein